MGDRANVGIRNSNGDIVFLYLHWGGFDRHEILAQALSYAMFRPNDEPYFTRVLISRIVGKDWSETTGVGLTVNILASPSDGYDVPVYNYVDKTVTVHAEKWGENGGTIDGENFETITVEQYLYDYAVRGVGAYV